MIAPLDPQEGQIIIDDHENKTWKYDGSNWIEVTHSNNKPKNTFGFRDIYSQGTHVYAWQVIYDGESISGTSGSIRQAYRDARKAVRRYRKMNKFLNR